MFYIEVATEPPIRSPCEHGRVRGLVDRRDRRCNPCRGRRRKGKTGEEALQPPGNPGPPTGEKPGVAVSLEVPLYR